jgi:hypothetical protein
MDVDESFRQLERSMDARQIALEAPPPGVR